MNATNKLLDKWWNVCKPETATEAGKRLGVSGQSIANYRAGPSQAAPHVIAAMAKDVGEEPAAWLALVESERARSSEDKKAWKQAAARLGLAAMHIMSSGRAWVRRIFTPEWGLSAA